MARERKFNRTDDLGLGSSSGNARSVSKDGDFILRRTGVSRFAVKELYHRLLTMPWGKFFLLVLLSYIIVNFIFAAVYYAIGVEHLGGIDPASSTGHKFMETFFFSSQTLTTLGYGRIQPTGMMASTVAAVESMLGLLGFAMATGILYGRFSRPQAKIRYSKNAVIAPYRDGVAFMFRIVNMRTNQLIEVEADITLSFQEKDKTTRSFSRLKLERNKINLFPLNWTIVHPIDEESVLYGLTEEEVAELDPEFIVLIKAFDDTYSQTVYSRSSYLAKEIVWGAKFKSMFSKDEKDGVSLIHLEMLDHFDRVPIPVVKKVVA